MSDFSKVAFNCCIKFVLIFVFVSIQLCHIVKNKEYKKKCKRDTKEKEKCNIIVVYLVRPSSYIALVD